MLNVGVRECRDSEEHPNTTPIIIAFDVTGSMGRIPLNLIKNQFPHLMSYLKEIGVQDPQILFMAIGDHYSDSYPIQVDQFEIDSEKIVNSLKTFYIEGGGGGNGGESYLLSWIIAGYHTETDAWFKRGKKGFLFTIGDEPCHECIKSTYLHRHLQYENGCSDITAKEALEKAQEQYHVFHIHCTDGSYPFSRITEKEGINVSSKICFTCWDLKDQLTYINNLKECSFSDLQPIYSKFRGIELSMFNRDKEIM